ncbi:MAG: limonene 1,2-monooxygenase [Acidimicrobiaceae bacterium]
MSVTQDWPLKFGIFLAPFHPVGQNPTLALERDLDLLVHLDELGFDEAWIGEHHSAGYEIIPSPEVFIAVAAERTKNLRLGTGVSSLPYHHPLMLADRMVLLDHLTRGRVMFGVGPGALPSDAFMMGIPVADQRDRMEEALEAILLLLRDEEPVTIKTDWFTLDNARLNLRPYTHPHFEVAVASQVSPTGARAAGKFGLSLLSLGATNTAGFDMLAYNWDIAEERAAQFDTTVDRKKWRLVGPMHIAETKEQAYADVQFGLEQWIDYFTRVAALPIAPDTSSAEEMADTVNASGFGVIGTPDDAIAQIERLIEQSNGGFGTFLNMAQDWADTAQTRKSYELLARYVFPHFQGSAVSTTRSRDWAAENRPTFIGEVGAAIMTAIGKHNQEQEARQAVD